MKDLNTLIQSAQQGDLSAYDQIVRQFQDMAVGYSYSLLRDFHWAEDAAQEAFLQAFLDLPTLRDALSFPGWFRRIVFKQCDRFTRRKRISTVSLETVQEAVCPAPGPAQAAEEAGRSACLHTEVACLPAREREVIALFYISGYSQEEIGRFLELPVTTVKKRLQTARQRLKERLLALAQNDLQQQAPSRDTRFADEISAALREFHAPNPDHEVSKMPWVKLYAALDEAANSARPVTGVQRVVFNALLKHTQELFPDDNVLQAIPEATYEDAAESIRLSAGLANHATCRGPVLRYVNVLREAHALRNDLAMLARVMPEQPAPKNAVTLSNALLQAVKSRHPPDVPLQAAPKATQGQSVSENENMRADIAESPKAAQGQSVRALTEAVTRLAQKMEDTYQNMTEAERQNPW